MSNLHSLVFIILISAFVFTSCKTSEPNPEAEAFLKELLSKLTNNCKSTSLKDSLSDDFLSATTLEETHEICIGLKEKLGKFQDIEKSKCLQRSYAPDLDTFECRAILLYEKQRIPSIFFISKSKQNKWLLHEFKIYKSHEEDGSQKIPTTKIGKYQEY